MNLPLLVPPSKRVLIFPILEYIMVVPLISYKTRNDAQYGPSRYISILVACSDCRFYIEKLQCRDDSKIQG